MRIQHNIMAMNAYRNYNTNTSALSKNLEKLSSGYKINRAGDDAAGLAISEKMRAQITGLNAASKNVKDGISLVKTAEGAMQEIQDMLNRMDYLATQSANGTYDNEVDRYNLQKEVNQLKSEINRIADSANFNGIKLLDGKAGINTTAFTFGTVDGAAYQDGSIDASKLISPESTTDVKELHYETESANAQPAKFSIDLTGLTVKNTNFDTGSTAKTEVAISLGSTALGKVEYDAKDNDNQNAAAIATDLKTALLAGSSAVDSSGGGGASDAIKIGDYVFKVGTSGNAVTFELAGTMDGTTVKSLADSPITSTQATAINNLIGASTTVAVTDADATGTADAAAGAKAEHTDVQIHNTTNVQQAVAKVDAGFAGIDITLDANLVKNGNTLTIDGQTFTFKTDASDTSLTGAGVIDVSGYKEADWVHAAVDLLSKETITATGDGAGRTWTIESKGNNKIHIDQTAATTDPTKALKTYDDLKKIITAQGTVTNAKGNGTTITIDPDKVAAGNKLTIGDTTYTFVKSGAKAAAAGDKEVEVNIEGGVAANLRTAINTVGDYTVDAATDNTVTVRAKVATDADEKAVKASKAPVISGTGLTLQIGDTSDSYNRLDVKIGDMHTSALDIDSVDISNPEGASSAIATIKSAINYVSGIRGDLGATQNRLEHTANNLSVMAENIQDAESTIRDTDVAEEMMAYTKNNILIQSAQAMLAQANAVPQGVLQLLG